MVANKETLVKILIKNLNERRDRIIVLLKKQEKGHKSYTYAQYSNLLRILITFISVLDFINENKEKIGLGMAKVNYEEIDKGIRRFFIIELQSLIEGRTRYYYDKILKKKTKTKKDIFEEKYESLCKEKLGKTTCYEIKQLMDDHVSAHKYYKNLNLTKEENNYLKVLNIMRNTTHNMSIYEGENKTISFQGETFNFMNGESIKFSINHFYLFLNFAEKIIEKITP